MKKERITRRWWFWLIVVLVVLLIVMEAYQYLIHKRVIERNFWIDEQSRCSKPTNLFCIDESEIMKGLDKIPCSSEEDCGWQRVREFCAPGDGSFTDCIGERIYCGKDGFCKQCRCDL